jgi:8-oxo-dGTP diphosphatase
MNKMLFRSAVFMIVRDEQGRVLLHRRANTGFMDGYYDFPSGHVDDGESFAESAVRELREETGLIAAQSDLSLRHVNQYYLDCAYINMIFDINAWKGTPTIMEPEKCDDMQFFALDALPDKCSLGVRDVERAGFVGPPTISSVALTDFENLVGVPFETVWDGQ